jgi:hypothetical protein
VRQQAAREEPAADERALPFGVPRAVAAEKSDGPEELAR